MRGRDRGQRDEIEKVRGGGGREWRGQRYDVETLATGNSCPAFAGWSLGLKKFKEGGHFVGERVLNKHTWHILTDVEGSWGQVLELWSLGGLSHVNINWGISELHFKDCNKGQMLPCHHRTLQR